MDYFGESGRNSNVFTADVQNLQTPDRFAGAGKPIVDFAALDARDHPGVTVTMESIVVAAATGRVRALGGSLTEAEMRAVLTEAGWPVELLAEALTVAYCESKWSNAKGDHNGHPTDGGYMSQGLFQMGVAGWRWVDGRWLWWNGWFRYFGYEDEQALDPLTNATVARLAYQRSGWGPWSCKP